jgi:hypothetical protein
MKLNPNEVGALLTLVVHAIQIWIVAKIIIHEWQAWRQGK